jgi:hypothetical protein
MERNSMRRLRGVVGVLLLGMAGACGGGDGALEPTDFAIQGTWYWEESLADQRIPMTCFDSGTVNVTQDGPRFQASGYFAGSCSGPGGVAPFEAPAALTDGVLYGDSIRFTSDRCPYRGRAYGAAPDSLVGTVTCSVVLGGVTAELSGPWRLLRSAPDREAPLVTATLSGSTAPPALPDAFMLGDSLYLSVQATDNRTLTWIGYTLSGPASVADSVATSGPSADVVLAALASTALVGGLEVAVFARDAGGNRSVTVVDTVTVVALRTAPTRTVTLPGPVGDLAYDPGRDRIYLAIAGTTQVAVVDRANATLLAPLTLPGEAGGLDLSAGRDSLLVALADRRAFAVVNLVTGAVDTVPLAFSTTIPLVAGRLRVAANGMVLVTATVPGWSGFGGQLATYSLAASSGTIRTDVGNSGQLDLKAELARVGDRSSAAVVERGVCCPIKGYRYAAANDAFTGPINTLDYAVPMVHGSAGRFLMANAVFDQNLALIRTVSDPDYTLGQPTAISTDGGTVFLGGTPLGLAGFIAVSVATGGAVDRAYVPGWAPNTTPDSRFTALADGATLLIFQGPLGAGPGSTSLHLVNLP